MVGAGAACGWHGWYALHTSRASRCAQSSAPDPQHLPHQTFGRNKPGNPFFHKPIDRYLNDSNLPPFPVIKGCTTAPGA